MVAGPNLVANHIGLHKQWPRAVGLGAIGVRIHPRADWFARQFAHAWHHDQQLLAQGTHTPTWEDCYSGNLSVRRDLFLEIGGFAADLRRSEDIELGYRLAARDASFVYLTEAACVQDDGKTNRELTTDIEKAGASLVAICRRHPSLESILLGGVADVSLWEVALRHLLWSLRISPRLLTPNVLFLISSGAEHRWYRFIFRFAYWRGARRALPDSREWARIARGTPILAYHAFSYSSEPGAQYITPIKKFERQMAWLRRLGFCALRLDDYLVLRRENRPLPGRSVVITIDDGYADVATLAAPVLKRFGFPATLFVVSSLVGESNKWDASGELSGRPLLTWEQLRQLSDDGIQIGAHTRTHPVLVDLSPGSARVEIESSKEDLENALALPISVFAYPYGKSDTAVEKMAETAGFLGSCTVDGGLNTLRTPAHALRRLMVDGRWWLPRFLMAVCLGRTRVHMRALARVMQPRSTRRDEARSI